MRCSLCEKKVTAAEVKKVDRKIELMMEDNIPIHDILGAVHQRELEPDQLHTYQGSDGYEGSNEQSNICSACLATAKKTVDKGLLCNECGDWIPSIGDMVMHLGPSGHGLPVEGIARHFKDMSI